MDKVVQDFLEAKRLAVVGVSHSPQKTGTSIYMELKQRGFEVYGVNPNLDAIDGEKCYGSVSELADKVDGVVVCIPPAKAAGVIREAAAAGIRNIWLQLGANSVETNKAAAEAGVSPVSGKCILMYAGEVKSIHAVHRFFAKLVGQY